MKKCRYCINDIEDKAIYCTKCNKSQNIYLNFLTTIGGLSAAFTIIIGVATYIGTNLPQLLEEFTTEHDIAIVKVDISGHAHSVVVENLFLNEVYLDEFIFYFPNLKNSKGNYSRSIEQTLKPKESKIIRYLNNKIPPAFLDISYINPKNITGMGRKMFKELADQPFQPICVSAQVAFPEEQFFDNIVKHHGGWENLLKVEHELFLRYYAPRTQKWKLLPVESTGVMVKLSDPNCFKRPDSESSK